MSLSINIKQFRKDNGISQEHIAEKLCVSQPTYWRIENSDRACAKRLRQLANALETTPKILQNYHLDQKASDDPEAADWVKALLEEKERTIQQQAEQLQFMNRYVDYMQAVWDEYGSQVGIRIRESPTLFQY